MSRTRTSQLSQVRLFRSWTASSQQGQPATNTSTIRFSMVFLPFKSRQSRPGHILERFENGTLELPNTATGLEQPPGYLADRPLAVDAVPSAGRSVSILRG